MNTKLERGDSSFVRNRRFEIANDIDALKFRFSVILSGAKRKEESPTHQDNQD